MSNKNFSGGEINAFGASGLSPGRRFWTLTEVAEYLGVPKSWVYNRTRTKGPETIPHFKVGKYLRFEPWSDEFQRWLDRHRRGEVPSDVGPGIYSAKLERQGESY